jgi:hypothetical protein
VWVLVALLAVGAALAGFFAIRRRGKPPTGQPPADQPPPAPPPEPV